MRIITLKTIMDQLESDAKGNRGCGWISLTFFGVLVVGGAASSNLLAAAFLVLMFGVPAILMLRSSRKQRQSIKDRSFYVVEDICIEKYTRSAGEDGDAYHLKFASGQDRCLSHGDVAMTFEANGYHDEDIYRATEPEDRFYMVYLEGDKEPTYVFSQKSCQLDMTGFTLRNGRIYPQKPQ